MRNMVKAVRAQQLYLPNNPMHKASLDAMRASFASVWKETEELTLTVLELEMKWSGVPVLVEMTKSSDSLPWLFFKDGIRELRFAKGVEDTDIVRFLEIVARARKARIDDDDLITMLWEAELTGVTYAYMDLLSEEGAPAELTNEAGSKSEPAAPGEIQAGVSQSAAESRNGVVNMADFDATLHFLDEKEVDYLKQEIAYEYQQDLRVNIVAALLDVFEQQPVDSVREEILDHIETMLAFMLASGSFSAVAYLLGETATAATRTGDLSPSMHSRISTLADRM